MRVRFPSLPCALIAGSLLISGCQPDDVRFEDNPVPYYDGVPTVIVDAYLTRVFIDLIGREPLTEELTAEREALRAGNLELDSRLELVQRLMGSDPQYLPHYQRKLSNDLSARFLDGASWESMVGEVQFLRGLATQDSLQGNTAGYVHFTDLANRMEAALDGVEEWGNDEISWREVSQRYCYNTFYDDLNMNSFNFIHATFDDLFGRNPTEAEFEQAYTAVEYSSPAVLMGTGISNKEEFLTALVQDGEFDEGAIRWWGEHLLIRPITTAEVSAWRTVVGPAVDIQALQRILITSDEYADFE
jgi:hypothetical protein